MIYTVVFLESATNDIATTYEYYATIDIKLIDKFEVALKNTVSVLSKNPKHYRKVKGENRQILIKGFNFVLVYQIQKSEILIARVFHTSRNPMHKFR